jgi:hypothetical protein
MPTLPCYTVVCKVQWAPHTVPGQKGVAANGLDQRQLAADAKLFVGVMNAKGRRHDGRSR